MYLQILQSFLYNLYNLMGLNIQRSESTIKCPKKATNTAQQVELNMPREFAII